MQDNKSHQVLNNSELFIQSKQYIPGGVNSPVRSFNHVGGTPFFTAKAKDCYLYDVEGNQYIDFISSWGANIVGHANSFVVAKVAEQLSKGFSYGTPTELELYHAKAINRLMPNLEKIRLVNSGTEAAMSAIRLARGFTERKYIVKFIGCYHGHSDSLLVSAGSGVATFTEVGDTNNTTLNTIASSAGVLEESINNTIVVNYNDSAMLKHVFADSKYLNQIAGVILEPFVGNMNLIKPTDEFLKTITLLCKEYNTLLIFDEVMTGFRVALGGAQQLLQIKPDLTILGKVVGGGMPLAAFGGRRDIMDYLSPEGRVYQAGTLSGNPVAVSAGIATLELIQQPGFYDTLAQNTKILVSGIKSIAKQYDFILNADYVCGMFGIYFQDKIPQNFDELDSSKVNIFKQFFHKMLQNGVFFAPSMYEAGFLCIAHTEEVINTALTRIETVIKSLR